MNLPALSTCLHPSGCRRMPILGNAFCAIHVPRQRHAPVRVSTVRVERAVQSIAAEVDRTVERTVARVHQGAAVLVFAAATQAAHGAARRYLAGGDDGSRLCSALEDLEDATAAMRAALLHSTKGR